MGTTVFSVTIFLFFRWLTRVKRLEILKQVVLHVHFRMRFRPGYSPAFMHIEWLNSRNCTLQATKPNQLIIIPFLPKQLSKEEQGQYHIGKTTWTKQGQEKKTKKLNSHSQREDESRRSGMVKMYISVCSTRHELF